MNKGDPLRQLVCVLECKGTRSYTPRTTPAEDSMLLSNSIYARSHAAQAARRLLALSRHLGSAVSQNYEYDLLVVGGGSGGLACSKEGGWAHRLMPMSYN